MVPNQSPTRNLSRTTYQSTHGSRTIDSNTATNRSNDETKLEDIDSLQDCKYVVNGGPGNNDQRVNLSGNGSVEEHYHDVGVDNREINVNLQNRSLYLQSQQLSVIYQKYMYHQHHLSVQHR